MNTLPRKEDINVYDSLDERYAVKEFYGKTREQIFEELTDGYQHMQESLAFMGPVGFAYYAPAWERLFTHFNQVIVVPGRLVNIVAKPIPPPAIMQAGDFSIYGNMRPHSEL